MLFDSITLDEEDELTWEVQQLTGGKEGTGLAWEVLMLEKGGTEKGELVWEVMAFFSSARMREEE